MHKLVIHIKSSSMTWFKYAFMNSKFHQFSDFYKYGWLCNQLNDNTTDSKQLQMAQQIVKALLH